MALYLFSDLEKFRRMCIEYKRQIDVIEAIENTHPIGICYIQLKHLKETAIPEPKRLLVLVKDTVPW